MYLRDPATARDEKIQEPEAFPFEIASVGRNRHHVDRRRSATRFRDTLTGPLRREGARRAGEGERVYVDRYRASDAALLLGIFLVNIADAFFTLDWIARGGTEGNPLMDWLLAQGQMAFLFFKCLAVGAWLLVLTVHKNFQLARWGLWVLATFYGLLLLYHIFLYLFAEPIPVRTL